jgi:serine/threonine protein kinase
MPPPPLPRKHLHHQPSPPSLFSPLPDPCVLCCVVVVWCSGVEALPRLPEDWARGNPELVDLVQRMINKTPLHRPTAADVVAKVGPPSFVHLSYTRQGTPPWHYLLSIERADVCLACMCLCAVVGVSAGQALGGAAPGPVR